MVVVRHVREVVHTPVPSACPPCAVFHDMGLFFGVLGPVVYRSTTHFMSPIDLMRDTLAWPRLMTKVKATHSSGQTFAYSLCVRRYREHVAKCEREGKQPEKVNML